MNAHNLVIITPSKDPKKNVKMKDFESLYCYLKALTGKEYVPYLDDSGLANFCYFHQLVDAQKAPEEFIPQVAKAAVYYACQDTSEAIVQISVCSRDATHKAWLAMAKEWPGATITKLRRKAGHGGSYNNRTLYSILLPSNH
jgi:hypothetical protein